MKRSQKLIWFVCSLVAVAWIAIVPAHAESATSFVGHVDVGPYAFIMLPVDHDDVDQYLPDGFRTIDLGGRAGLVLFLGTFRNLSVDLQDGISQADPDPFWVSELAILTYGPEGSRVDSGGLLYLRRLWNSRPFAQAMATLGVTCGAESSRTQVCHAPNVTGSLTASLTATTLEVSVPRGENSYSASVTLIPAEGPCVWCRPEIAAWHVGSRGLVRETVSFSEFPDAALIGLGTGTVRAARGSELYHMLGDMEQAIGPASGLRAHIDGDFELV